MTEGALPSYGGLSLGWTLFHHSRVSGTVDLRLPAPHPSSPARSLFCLELKNAWRDPHWVRAQHLRAQAEPLPAPLRTFLKSCREPHPHIPTPRPGV